MSADKISLFSTRNFQSTGREASLRPWRGIHGHFVPLRSVIELSFRRSSSRQTRRSLMAAATFLLAPFYQDQSNCRTSKEIPTALGYGKSRDVLKSSTMLVGSHQVEDQWLSMNLLPASNQLQRSIPTMEKSVLIDVQDTRPDSVLFSFGIAEQCARRDTILRSLFSGSSEEEGISTTLLSDLMGLKTVAIDTFDMLSLYEAVVCDSDQFLYPSRQFHIPKPLHDFIADSSGATKIAVHPDGRMLLTGSESELKDLLSVAAEFNMLKSFTTCNTHTMVVPYFTRSRGGHARISSQGSAPNLTVAPSRSPENIKLKTSPKKKRGKRAANERDLYQKNYFRAWENLLSVVLDKKRTGEAVHSLKKSGPEITHLLSQFAAGIAGTGLAILFSVACKAANGRVSLSAAKVLNTGLGIGFFWLSWAVNTFRNTVADISKSSSKLRLTEEEIVGKVDRSVNEVLFRALALLAIAVLRFA